MSYFTIQDADQFTFYRIPKILFTDDRYKEMSTDSKVLYGLLLDRVSLSTKNNWVDDLGRVFIIFSRESAQELLGYGNKKIVKMFKELKEFCLIEEKQQGLGMPNIIYVKKFLQENPVTLENQLTCQNDTSGDVKITLPEMSKSHANYTEINKTEINKTETSVSQSTNTNISALEEVEKMIANSKTDRQTDNIRDFKKSPKKVEDHKAEVSEKKKNQLVSSADSSRDIQFIMSQLNLNDLKLSHPNDESLIGDIELNIHDMYGSDYIIVQGVKKSSSIVRSALMRLTYWHMDEILRKLRDNTSEIKNTKGWLQATIFNQAFENEFSIQNKVNFALYGDK
jgi:hypothetical protein